MHHMESTSPAHGWPPALIQATLEPGPYTLGLTSGRTITFEDARDLGHGFVALTGAVVDGQHAAPALEIRVSDIVWIQRPVKR